MNSSDLTAGSGSSSCGGSRKIYKKSFSEFPVLSTLYSCTSLRSLSVSCSVSSARMTKALRSRPLLTVTPSPLTHTLPYACAPRLSLPGPHASTRGTAKSARHRRFGEFPGLGIHFQPPSVGRRHCRWCSRGVTPGSPSAAFISDSPSATWRSSRTERRMEHILTYGAPG